LAHEILSGTRALHAHWADHGHNFDALSCDMALLSAVVVPAATIEK
jgi:hypothetical protein